MPEWMQREVWQHGLQDGIQGVGRTSWKHLQAVRWLDLCAGQATVFYAATEAGIVAQKYYYVDNNGEAGDVTAAVLARIRSQRPEQLSADALREWESAFPQDLRTVAQRAAQIFSDMEELPTVIAATVPCTDTSMAGEGAGLTGNRSSLVYQFASTVLALAAEYKNRGWSSARRAPFIWIMETSPIYATDGRANILRAKAILRHLLGEHIFIDAASAGSRSHRRTWVFSNMGSKQEFMSFQNAPQLPYIISLAELYEAGEQPQITQPWHVSPHYPYNVIGSPVEVAPKHLRTPESKAFRPHAYGPGKHAVGAVWIRGQISYPTLRHKEKSMGYPKGYNALKRFRTAQTAVNSIPEDLSELTSVAARQRHQFYGDAVDPNLFTRLFAASLLWQGDPDPAEEECATRAEEPQSEKEQSAEQQPEACTPPGAIEHLDNAAAVIRNLTQEPHEGALPAEYDIDEVMEDQEEAVAPNHSHQNIPIPSPCPPAPEYIVPPPMAEDQPEYALAVRCMQEYLELLDMRKAGVLHPEQQKWSDVEWLLELGKVARSKKGFIAGNLHRCREIWKVFVQHLPEQVQQLPHTKRIMKIINSGFHMDFLHPFSGPQQQHPKYRKNIEKVKRSLTRVYGAEAAEKLINRNSPGQVHLPNLQSYHDNIDFVREQLKTDLLPKRKVMKWWYPNGELPQCILQLGVDIRAVSGKKRIFWNGSYINLFQRYIKFPFEGVRDMTRVAEMNGYMVTSDIAAGYHHISLSDETVKYFAFEVDGVIYVWLVAPFGVAHAPRIYTEITSFQLQPIRDAGVKMVLYIDDRWLTDSAENRLRLRQDNRMTYLLEWAHGWATSMDKAQPLPEHEALFLGLITDLLKGRFYITEEKMACIVNLVRDILQVNSITSREISQVSGKIISCSWAVKLAPLFCRDLWADLRGSTQLDDRRSLTVTVQNQLQFLVDNLADHNGSLIWPPMQGMVVAGDASAIGFGARLISDNTAWDIPDEAWEQHMLAVDAEMLKEVPIFRTTFSDEDVRAAMTNSYSSTLREVRCIQAWVKSMRSFNPGKIERKPLLYLTDSMDTMYDINKMQGSGKIWDAVKQLWIECMDNNINLTTRWLPRSNAVMVGADVDSKDPDPTAWELSPWHTQYTLDMLGAPQPDLDCFSDDRMKKADQFFSFHLCPGTSGIDGFLQQWRTQEKEHPLCWVNGPFHRMLDIVCKIKEEQADCILIAPAWGGGWKAVLSELPVVKTILLPKQDESGQERLIFIPSARVPEKQRMTGSRRQPKYAVYAYYIRWVRQPATQQAQEHQEAGQNPRKDAQPDDAGPSGGA